MIEKSAPRGSPPIKMPLWAASTSGLATLTARHAATRSGAVRRHLLPIKARAIPTRVRSRLVMASLSRPASHKFLTAPQRACVATGSGRQPQPWQAEPTNCRTPGLCEDDLVDISVHIVNKLTTRQWLCGHSSIKFSGPRPATPALVEPDKRFRPKDQLRALRRYEEVCSSLQSIYNFSCYNFSCHFFDRKTWEGVISLRNFRSSPI